MGAVTVSILGFLVIAATCIISHCDGIVDVICIDSEREALLKFKHDLIDDSDRLSSWVEDTNYCQWVGVFCNNLTGHVTELQLRLLSSSPEDFATDDEWEVYHRSKLGGKINPSLVHLEHLSLLDLSNNDFGGMEIPKFIGSLKSLTYLNLSWSYFQGEIPHNLGNLSELRYLDLGNNYLSGEISSLGFGPFCFAVINHLPLLVELHLSGCSLENDPYPVHVNYTSLRVLHPSSNMLRSIPTWVFHLHNLVSIDLSGNSVNGRMPSGFQNISCLEFLDLSSNDFSSSFIPVWLSTLNHLEFLGLSTCGLQGDISSAIVNMTSVTHLDLSNNQFQIIPKCLESLCNLREMDLSVNEIDKEVSEIIQSLSSCGSDRLYSLKMAFNQLSGTLTDQIGKFRNLEYLSLSQNYISGPIPLSIGKLSSLRSLDISHNRLNANLPQSLGGLGSLEILDVSKNMLQGNVSEMHFSNLTRLKFLSASRNVITFKPNPSWIPPFRCERIELGDWYLGPEFPQWLLSQNNLSDLDISNSGLAGVLPTLFWNISIQFSVNLSHNQLVGEIPHLPTSTIVDFSSNQFTGPLPRVSSDVGYLFLSRNLFSGSLFHLICKSDSYLAVLDIESNLLSGQIPNCWRNESLIDRRKWLLFVLNLAKNNLSGKFPRSLGFMSSIKSLRLSNNNLHGEIPPTMQRLRDLIILDLSENQFNGSIASLGVFENIVVLNLRSNEFHGHISHQICGLISLQILDLSHNNISGAIPNCLKELVSMTETSFNKFGGGNMEIGIDYGFINLAASVVMRGREDVYSTTLALVKIIDLSSNNLTGEIPNGLGNLVQLQSLNLSGNSLTGKIPESIGQMESLESLDLSMNNLHGEIPPSLSNLNFLNHLNLSSNNLTGQIPSSTQLQSFDRFSYMCNHLCGRPLTRKCSKKYVTSGNDSKEASSEGPKKFKVNWLYVSIVLGFVFGFWGVVAPLFFIRAWRITYYRKLDEVRRKLYVFWATLGK